jgi:hypothetical protein
VSANNFQNSVTPHCGKVLPATRKVISLVINYSYCVPQHILTNTIAVTFFKTHDHTKFLLLTDWPLTTVTFFQKSGIPLDVTVRFQINMALGDLSGITRAAKFSNMILPMLWTEFVSTTALVYNNTFNLMWCAMPKIMCNANDSEPKDSKLLKSHLYVLWSFRTAVTSSPMSHYVNTKLHIILVEICSTLTYLSTTEEFTAL